MGRGAWGAQRGVNKERSIEDVCGVEVEGLALEGDRQGQPSPSSAT